MDGRVSLASVNDTIFRDECGHDKNLLHHVRQSKFVPAASVLEFFVFSLVLSSGSYKGFRVCFSFLFCASCSLLSGIAIFLPLPMFSIKRVAVIFLFSFDAHEEIRRDCRFCCTFTREWNLGDCKLLDIWNVGIVIMK